MAQVGDERDPFRNPVLKETGNLTVRLFGLLGRVIGQVLPTFVEVDGKVLRLNVIPLLILIVDLILSESEILCRD